VEPAPETVQACRDIHVHKVAGLLIVRNFVYIYGAPVKQSNRPGLFSRIYSLFAISLCILYSGSISTELVSDTEGSTPSRYCRKKQYYIVFRIYLNTRSLKIKPENN